MCGRYAQYAPIHLTDIMLEVLADIDSGFDFADEMAGVDPAYNIAPTQQAAVLAARGDGLALRKLRWGLVPGWAKDIRIGAKAINARSETVDSKPMFRAAFKKHRALVPASGYFEWRVEQGGVKQPYFIHAPDDRLLMFAGLWSAWRPEKDAEPIKTFTILTGSAGAVAGQIHARQPVMLAPQSWQAWLTGSPDAAKSVLDSEPENDLAFYAVSRAVNSPRNQGPELIEPCDLPGDAC